MHDYDAIVIGAGPAGGQCARQLAQLGYMVLLAEKSENFTINNYSSGGAPLEIMKQFALPEKIVGAYWHKLSMMTSKEKHVWESSKPLGVVLDFLKLRTFLSEEAVKYGGRLMLGWAYQSHRQSGNFTHVTLKRHGSHEMMELITKVLVDATGTERGVLAKNSYNSSKAMAATGIEYLIESDPANYQKYADALSFYFGHQWMPQGYAWIFPMEANLLKVGVIRYFQHDVYVPYEKTYRHYLEMLMEKAFQTKDLPVLDKHGKTIHYTYSRKDVQHEGNIIAIGDSVSTINPMGCEGIRHAMASGEIAAKHIMGYLEGNQSSFKGYVEEMRSYCGIKWTLSEIIMKKIYREPNDGNIDLALQVVSKFKKEDIMDFLFFYKVPAILKFFIAYSLRKSFYVIKSLLKRA